MELYLHTFTSLVSCCYCAICNEGGRHLVFPDRQKKKEEMY